MQGLLLINKPLGWTSFDAVRYIRKVVAEHEKVAVRAVKAGHAGTLDPLATGLLLVLIGSATKQASTLLEYSKEYRVEMRLGEESSTGDAEGEKRLVSQRRPEHEEIEEILAKFKGEQLQVPPSYSAIKIGGKRAYDRARSGEAVLLQPRPITVHSLTLEMYEYPVVEWKAKVSSGTYIRSLAQDMGRAWGTGAYVTKLCRTAIGPYNLEAAIDPRQPNLLDQLQKL